MTLNTENAYVFRFKRGVADGALTALAALLAYLPAQAFGIYQGFWGSIIAISVVQTEIGETEKIARNQFIGAAIGGCVSLIGLLLFGQGIVIYAVTIALTMIVCALLDVMKASRLAGITCTIVMLVPSTGSPLDIFLTRFGEVCWGAFVGFTTVWVADRVRRACFE
ncbi:MAG: FUSC family protein [Xanthobacteraceae bacterium]|nr:FUSC family protein [Xanthobacteraceae bacterium]